MRETEEVIIQRDFKVKHSNGKLLNHKYEYRNCKIAELVISSETDVSINVKTRKAQKTTQENPPDPPNTLPPKLKLYTD